MKTRQVIGISVLSCLVTLLAVFVVLSSSRVAVAQKPDPTPISVQQVTPLDPNALTVNSEEPAMSEATEQPNAMAVTTDYLHVAGSAFVPLYGDAGVTYGGKGCTYMTGYSHLYMNYSLDLPHNSIITFIRIYFIDTNTTDGIMHLARYDDGVAYDYPATVYTSGSSGFGKATLSDLNIQLDNLNYNYVMYWMPGVAGSSMQLCGFRVNYERPFLGATFLPAVLTNAK
ncbi:MAG: hypothetical protein ACOY16_06805 [Chloroflexota bacterium]